MVTRDGKDLYMISVHVQLSFNIPLPRLWMAAE